MKQVTKFKWKFWEYTLMITGWLFGYGHEVYFNVKHKRNMAYLRHVFHKRG